jgi:hypothetical protein
MVQALGPILKDKQRASKILERCWQEKIAIVWNIEQIFRAANECKVALTRVEAIEVLRTLHHNHNPQYGLKWSDLTDYIRENVLGRGLTKTELKRFIEQDVITVQKQGKRQSKYRYSV